MDVDGGGGGGLCRLHKSSFEIVGRTSLEAAMADAATLTDAQLFGDLDPRGGGGGGGAPLLPLLPPVSPSLARTCSSSGQAILGR